MDADRIARTVARLPDHEVREFLQACSLFERAGIWTPEEAYAWREAVRATAAELSEPVAEAYGVPVSTPWPRGGRSGAP